MLKFLKKPNVIILSYTGDQTGSQWVYSELNDKGSVTLRRIFTVSKDDLISEPYAENEDAPVEFEIAVKEGECYRISKDILSLEHDVFIQEDMQFTNKTLGGIHSSLVMVC